MCWNRTRIETDEIGTGEKTETAMERLGKRKKSEEKKTLKQTGK
jgi:hypothetical protein